MVTYAIAEGIDSVTNDCTSCDQNVDNITKDLNSVAIQNDISTCAACGKKGNNDDMNACNKCKMVKYCNAACKKKHRTKHEKACERRVAELHEKQLFKQPPPKEDCPICFIRIPTLDTGHKYMSCCGKVICSGCGYAPVYDNQGNEVADQVCSFCRTPLPASYEESMERLTKRVEVGDAKAIYNLGYYYSKRHYGFPLDMDKALELFYQAGELGYAAAHCSIGYSYQYGHGVEVQNKKAMHYYELAAIGGGVQSRHNLGIMEKKTGNMERALRHFIIAAEGGFVKSLQNIKSLYSYGHATKEDYTKALRSYQTHMDEIKSKQRDAA